MIFRRWSLE
ncbi:Protein of unknown function [Lactobacillus delbrueckii subsp. bulgaricus]|nr:Protein of unknown function [Lactobacillus delbrueckii subsp. bulgaricus]CDR74832.1 Protein of unknown function [Lactobacillus delbrueckii subsp. bulgaricus]